MKKIIAFAGSNHSQSINQQLVQAAARKLPRAAVQIIQLYDYPAPLFSEDLELEKGIPDSIHRLYQLFRQADGFLVASPEHNGLLPAFFKNTIDWLSRIDQKIFNDKPVLLLSTSPGQNGGQTNLKILLETIPWWGAQVVGHFSLGRFYENFDQERMALSNPGEEQRLDAAMEQFSKTVFREPMVVQSDFQPLKKAS